MTMTMTPTFDQDFTSATSPRAAAIGRRFKRLVPIAVIALTLAACQQGPGGFGTKTTVGALGGAAAGGLIGSALGGGAAGIAGGVLLGGLLGGALGNSLDQQDQMYMQRNQQRTLETASSGQSYAWANPDSGRSGSIQPTRTFQRADGTYCREFTQQINVDGQVQQGYGTACRQANGSWQIIQ